MRKQTEPNPPPLGRARELYWRCRWLGLALVVRLALCCMPLPRLLAWLTPHRITPRSPLRCQQLTRALDYALQLPLFPRRHLCLLRSLLLYRLLASSGLPVCFNLGVSKRQHELVGHSWVTCAGQTWWEDSDFCSQFELIYSRQAPILDSKGETHA